MCLLVPQSTPQVPPVLQQELLIAWGVKGGGAEETSPPDSPSSSSASVPEVPVVWAEEERERERLVRERGVPVSEPSPSLGLGKKGSNIQSPLPNVHPLKFIIMIISLCQ